MTTSVVLAGGGTAGHTSPLIATAEELMALQPDLRLTAVGTARGLETTVVPAAGLTLELIPPVPMPRSTGLDLLRVPGRLAGAVKAAGRVLDTTGADVVLGFGGYVSTPVYLAARQRRVPIVLHEQNALPGLANKLAARLTRHVFTSFPETALPHARYLGLPLRRSIVGLDRERLRADARTAFGLRPDLPTLLVSGGSQGAQRINTAVRGALADLLSAGIQVLHVVGPRNLTADVLTVTDAVSGAVYAPVAYVEQMELAYAAADLMLARCGASTVLETAAVGLPAVFVPYPHGNGEQARNAAIVVRAGGGLLLEDVACTAGWVSTRIAELFASPQRLAGMAAATRSVARVDAAEELAVKTLEASR